MPSNIVHVAISFANGPLAIMQFVTEQRLPDGSILWERAPTDENIQAEIDRTAFDPVALPVTGWRRVNQSDLPPDRDFRDCWVDSNGKIGVDLGRARIARLNELRAERDARLEKLDTKFQIELGRAVTTGNYEAVKAVESERQALRDQPAVLSSRLMKATTLQQIRAIALE